MKKLAKLFVDSTKSSYWLQIKLILNRSRTCVLTFASYTAYLYLGNNYISIDSNSHTYLPSSEQNGCHAMKVSTLRPVRIQFTNLPNVVPFQIDPSVADS